MYDIYLDENQRVQLRGYHKLSVIDKARICNGMGSEKTWWDRLVKRLFLSNDFFGLDMTEEANEHDYMYFKGGNMWHRTLADMIWLYNMCHKIYHAGKAYRLRRYGKALIYFTVVFFRGKSRYNIKMKEDAKEVI
jgi:hypothetical protein